MSAISGTWTIFLIAMSTQSYTFYLQQVHMNFSRFIYLQLSSNPTLHQLCAVYLNQEAMGADRSIESSPLRENGWQRLVERQHYCSDLRTTIHTGGQQWHLNAS